MAEPGTETPARTERREPLGLRIKENVEAFFFAVLLVLILRHFSVEAFQIPTGSMEPTLVGDQIEGDRILVDKFVYHFVEPERWDVVVFHYPLNRQKNFIKRLVGRPGERIAIADGDVYVDGIVADKPADVQEALWVPVLAGPSDVEGRDPDWEGPYRLDGRRLTVDGRDDAEGRYADLVRTEESIDVRGAGAAAGDVRVAFRVLLVEGTGTLRIRLISDHEVRTDGGRLVGRKRWTTFDLAIAPGGWTGIRVEERDGDGPLREIATDGPADRVLVPGHEVAVVASRLDGRARLEVDGQVVAEVDGRSSLEDAPRTTTDSRVAFGPVAALAEFSEVAISRDIHYTSTGLLAPGHEVHVPPGRYLVLGDNSANSRDSRLWSIFRITTDDGRTIEGEVAYGEEANPLPPVGDGQELRFRDTDGFLRTLSVEEVQRIEIVPWLEQGDAQKIFPRALYDPASHNDRGQPILDRSDPFHQRSDPVLRDDEVAVATVAHDLIIGRAFFVFWPHKRGGVWHLKFIR